MFRYRMAWPSLKMADLASYDSMIKAAELLKLTSYPINEIGNAVGYPNQLHFSRAFKSVYGVSPRNWRKDNSVLKSSDAQD